MDKKKRCAECGREIFYVTYHGGGKFIHVVQYGEHNEIITNDHHAREEFVSTNEFAWSEENGVMS